MAEAPVLITGAAKRIGRAIALGLAGKGHPVVLHYRNSQSEAEALLTEIRKSGGRGALVRADLANPEDVKKVISAASHEIGQPLEILINNAGAYVEDCPQSITHKTIRENFAPNIEAPLLLSSAFAEQLPKGKPGNIINIIDQRVLKTTPGFLSYTVSKHALYAATRLLALDLAPRIRVNAIGPGPTFKNQFQSDEDFNAESKSVPLGRGPKPEEIVDAILFLLASPSVTGQMITLDGGQHLL